MQILLIGPYWGNSKHGAEVGVVEALRSLQCYVSICDNRVKKAKLHFDKECEFESLDSLNSKSDFHRYKPDVILCLGPGITPEIAESDFWKSKSGAHKILWNSEPIRLTNYRDRIIASKKYFDTICTFDESEIPRYRQLGVEALFLPQAFNPNWYKPLENVPHIPNKLCFVGSIGGKWQNRVDLINRLKEVHIDVDVTTTFDASLVNRIYNMHDAVLNLGLYCTETGAPSELRAFGLQQRIFESIGAGVPCVTNVIPPGTNELFENGKNILFYDKNNLETVVMEVFQPETNKELRKNILAIREQHTYAARMRQLFSMLSI